MPQFASTARKPGAAPPKFAGTGAGFLTQAALVGELIAAKPVGIERGEYQGRETVRLKCDVVVLTGPNKGEHPNVLFSGGKIIEQGQRILDTKADEVLLGRMTRQPMKAFKAQWPTPAALEAALADPAVAVPITAYAWLIPDANASDIQIATEYYTGGTIPDTDDEDPYAD